MHVDHNAIGVARGGCHEQALHQPAIFFGSGFESRHGAEIDQRGIDRFTAVELFDEFGRTPADASILDLDHRAIVGLERVFRLKLDRGVRPHDLEIRAEGTDFSIDVPAPDLAANNRNDAALADADIAGRCNASDMRGDGEDIAGGKDRFHLNIRSIGFALRDASLSRCSSGRGLTPHGEERGNTARLEP